VSASGVAVIAAALGATGFFALSSALKHRSADRTPLGGGGGRGASAVRFLLATLRQPLWLAGLGADAGGVTLQVTALHLGALAVVQPVMITALLFALVLNHRVAGTRVPRREVAGALALIAGLVGFLVISGASSPRVTGVPQAADRQPAVVVALVAVGLVALCVVQARRVSRATSAALLGVAVGLVYACTAALIKACSDVLVPSGPLALLTSWQLPTLVVAGAFGLALNQLAFKAGPLNTSLPAIATVDPLVSIVLGVLVYDERLRSSAAAVVGEVACLVLLSAAVVQLSRSGAAEAPVAPVPESSAPAPASRGTG
jgi:drug/metabolite transporter (DMT)-like permease